MDTVDNPALNSRSQNYFWRRKSLEAGAGVRILYANAGFLRKVKFVLALRANFSDNINMKNYEFKWRQEEWL